MQFSEVKFSPEKSYNFLGWPQILRRADGMLLASHDYFGWSRNLQGKNVLSSFYLSEDEGTSWQNITHVPDAVSGTLFEHRGDLYFLCNSYEHGPVTIRRSADGGYTWSPPNNSKTGMLFSAEGICVHPTPLLHWNGRLYKAVDSLADPSRTDWFPRNFRAGVMSAPENCDLLNAENWTFSNFLEFEPDRCVPRELAEPSSGWLEGNIVPAPDNQLYNMMRIQLKEANYAALLKVDPDGKRIYFDYHTGLIRFFGGRAKIAVKFDPESHFYLTLTNEVPDGVCLDARNRLILAASADLFHWRKLTTLLSDDSGLSPEDSVRYTGFQYADWQFDGENIIFLCRTAYRGANSYHDSNRITFHVIRNFRRYLNEKSEEKP